MSHYVFIVSECQISCALSCQPLLLVCLCVQYVPIKTIGKTQLIYYIIFLFDKGFKIINQCFLSGIVLDQAGNNKPKL